jgi:hypothetical protein
LKKEKEQGAVTFSTGNVTARVHGEKSLIVLKQFKVNTTERYPRIPIE